MATTIAARTQLPGTSRQPRPWRPRLALVVLLAGTAVLYLWGLSASGWANAFYSAAAQAGAQSWTAWFFGSSDAANAITVDKTPAALWVTGLSARLLGLSSWSVLVPQALMGVAAVAVLHQSVRRTAGPPAALLAGAVIALTPVAVLMFRFNNPDALLTLLLVGAAYALLRAVEGGRTRWLLLAAALVGFGFLTKMLQAFLVLPVFAAIWLLAAPVGIGRRVRDLLLAGVVTLISAGWSVLVVELWPAQSRPYIGGSQTNSMLELIFGYNGFGRLTGNEVGSVGGMAPGAAQGSTGSWGQTELTRLLTGSAATDVAWLVPTALLLVASLLWWTRRTPRTDPVRAATLTWGGWLIGTGLVFSLMAGIFHQYYLVILAPAIGAVIGIGAVATWQRRATTAGRIVLVLAVGLTAGWSFALLFQAGWQPWLAWAVLGAGGLACVGVLVVKHLPRAVVPAVMACAVVAALAGPVAWSIATAAQPHTGAIPSAGPQGVRMGGAGMRIGRDGGGPGGPQWRGDRGLGNPPRPNPAGRGRGGGMMGGLLSASTPSAALTTFLQQDAASYTWAAATIRSNNAAGYQLASGAPVIALGGFNGTDPFPTLEQFQQFVADGRVHYFVGDAGRANTESGGSGEANRIGLWVEATFTPTVIDGTPVYDLTRRAAAGAR